MASKLCDLLFAFKKILHSSLFCCYSDELYAAALEQKLQLCQDTHRFGVCCCPYSVFLLSSCDFLHFCQTAVWLLPWKKARLAYYAVLKKQSFVCCPWQLCSRSDCSMTLSSRVFFEFVAFSTQAASDTTINLYQTDD